MELTRRITRWLFAVGGIGLSIYLIRVGIGRGGITSSFLPILGAMSLLVISVIVIAPELVKLFTMPLFALTDSIFFPGEKLGKPVLSYTLPDFYTKEGRYEEAVEEYRKILKHYPEETAAYLGVIELLVTELGDRTEAKHFYTQARQRLRNRPEELEAVRNRWRHLGFRD